jgi:hypothetical protein
LNNVQLAGIVLASFAFLANACGEESVSDDGLGGGRPEFIVDGAGGTGGTSQGSGGQGSGQSQGSGGGTGGTVVSAAALDYCTIDGMPSKGDPAVSLLIDDFDDGDPFVSGNGMAGNWYGYGDPGGAQTPTWDGGEWSSEVGGLKKDGYALHAVGGGYDEWGSGQGFSPAWSEARDQNCLYDASLYDGISFWIRGEIIDEDHLVSGTIDDSVLRFGVVEPDVVPVEEGGNCTGNAGACWDWHKTRIELDECFRRHSFRFDELEQDGWGADAEELDMDRMINFNFEIAQGHRYDFWLDEVTFFVGEAPPEEEICDLGMGGAGGAGGAANP